MLILSNISLNCSYQDIITLDSYGVFEIFIKFLSVNDPGILLSALNGVNNYLKFRKEGDFKSQDNIFSDKFRKEDCVNQLNRLLFHESKEIKDIVIQIIRKYFERNC